MVLPHSFHGWITFYCSPDYFTMEFYQERNRTNFTAIFSENISEVIIIHLSCNPNGKIWKTHFLWFFLWRVINSFSYHCIHWLFFFPLLCFSWIVPLWVHWFFFLVIKGLFSISREFSISYYISQVQKSHPLFSSFM